MERTDASGQVLVTSLSQLELIENVVKLDSKLLMVRDRNKKTIGMLTVNDALLELVGQEFPEASQAA